MGNARWNRSPWPLVIAALLPLVLAVGFGCTSDGDRAGVLVEAGTPSPTAAAPTLLPTSPPMRLTPTGPAPLSDLPPPPGSLPTATPAPSPLGGGAPAAPTDPPTTGITEIDTVIRVALGHNSDGLLGLVEYTTVQCSDGFQGIGTPPLCSDIGVPSRTPVEVLPIAGGCELLLLPKLLLPDRWRRAFRAAGEFVFFGAFVPAGRPLLLDPAPDYAVMFRAPDARFGYGTLYVRDGRVVGWGNGCAQMTPRDEEVARWVVHPEDLGFDLTPQPPPTPVAPQLDDYGNEVLMPGGVIIGGKTYRLGLGPWLVDIPVGASFEFGVAVNLPGGAIYFFDDFTGSRIFISSETGLEVERRITDRGRDFGAESRFDLFADSVRPVQ